MRYWFCFLCFIVILIIHIKHLFTLFLNFYIQSTLSCMTSCHGATPTVNSRCTNPTRVHRSWLWVHDFTSSMERSITWSTVDIWYRSWCPFHQTVAILVISQNSNVAKLAISSQGILNRSKLIKKTKQCNQIKSFRHRNRLLKRHWLKPTS